MVKGSKVPICFLSGVTLFIVNLSLGLAGPGFHDVFILAMMIAPGLIFGLVLVSCFARTCSLWKIITFLFLSTALQYCASIIALWGLTPGLYHWSNFPLGATAGAVGLVLAYKKLIDPGLSLRKGLAWALVTGVASALILAANVEFRGAGLPGSDWFDISCTLSIFVIWQTLFGLTLDKAGSSRAGVSEDPRIQESDTVR